MLTVKQTAELKEKIIRKCPCKPQLDIYCAEKSCTLDCDIYKFQSGYLSHVLYSSDIDRNEE